MDNKKNKVAASANRTTYDIDAIPKNLNDAPHIKHASIRQLYSKLINQVYKHSKKFSAIPQVLDLGAGAGSVTLPFLELGARVVAVDISRTQLDALQNKCKLFADKLELRCEDISETLKKKDQKFDIVVANSFLHHIPDYSSLITDALDLLTPNGQFFSFQDPLRYDTVDKFTKTFSNLAYISWRIFKGDVLGGIKRRLRRSRGIYLIDSLHDNVEYHVVRNGVDQNAIASLLMKAGFDCNIVPYFSTHSSFFQILGNTLGLKNTFAIIARNSHTHSMDDSTINK